MGAIFVLLDEVARDKLGGMPQPRSKRIALLESYEELTRKESVCIREGNIEPLAALQEKKAALIAALQQLSSEDVSAEERTQFNQRLVRLQETEEANAEGLGRLMAENRDAYRKLGQNASSASKLRRAYAGKPGDDSERSLKHKA